MRLGFPLHMFLIVCLPIVGVGQSIITVPSASFPTIQSAINGVSAGGTVLVAPGTYVENLSFPGKPFHLLGAGPGQSIIDGNANGTCLKFQAPFAGSMVVEGFTITNGSGELAWLGAFMVRSGGGIFISHPLYAAGAPISPTIKNCEITQNTADQAAAVFIRFGGNVRLINCQIHNNSVTGQFLGVSVAIHAGSGRTRLFLTGCSISNHTAPTATGLIKCDSAGATLVDCEMTNNTVFDYVLDMGGSAGAVLPVAFTLKRCTVQQNTILANMGVLMTLQSSLPITVDDCLFTKNSGNSTILLAVSSNTLIRVRSSTITDNQLAGSTLAVLTFGNGGPDSNRRIENTIICGNTDSSGAVVPAVLTSQSPTPTSYTATHSLIETPANSATFTVPLFRDPVNNDYRLKPGSVGIDGGTWYGLNPFPGLPDDAVDRDGKPRVRLTEVDIGCYEAQHIAFHPAIKGRVGATAGGPFDILEINGSAGDDFRTVTVPLGSSATLSLLQPPHISSPVNFAIFGLIGEARLEDVLPVPLGIGDMIFPLCPLYPALPVLFTLTNNFGPACPQLTPSNPSPWVSAPFPPIPFPVTLTFQGIIEEAPGQYVPTNGVIYKVQ